jgi:alpha-glucosidase
VDHAGLAVDRQEADPASMLALTRRLIALRAAHPALRCGDNAHWVVEGDLLAFDRIAGGETIRCLFNLGGGTIDLGAHGANGVPLVALNGADSAALPPCGTLWLQMEG